MPGPERTRARLNAAWSGLGNHAAAAVAIGVMNVTTYGFTIASAHGLGPRQYGAVASLMGLLLVLNVVALGLQTTGARRISRQPERADQIARQVLSVSYRAAFLLGLVCTAAIPLMVAVLHLDSWLVAAMVALTVMPQTAMLGRAGILQGQRRWLAVAWIYALIGLGRLAFGVLGMVVRPDALGAMTGVAIGAIVPYVAVLVALRERPGPAPPDSSRKREPLGSVVVEVARNCQALLAFLAVSNADIVVARNSLPERQAGLYAGGLILVKAVLFLPQFVIVLAFPSMASGGAQRNTRHLQGIALVAGLGMLTTVAAAVLPGLALLFVGGHQYADIESRLWVFGVLGLVLSLMQLLIYDVVARQHHVAVVFVWVALAAIAVSVGFVDDVGQLLAWVTTVDAVLVVALLVLSFPDLRPRRRGSVRRGSVGGALPLRRGSVRRGSVSRALPLRRGSVSRALPLRRGSVSRGVPTEPAADRDVERDGQLGG